MLKDPSMRQRHWDNLNKIFNTLLNYDSDSFTINELFELNILSQAENVREICETAKE